MSNFRVNSSGASKQSHFSRIPQTINAPRSAFDRSFSHKTTFNEGSLIPFLWEPILPGDTINLSTTALIRLATPKFPYMDNLYADIHYFFIPNRLLWDNWERFQGAQDDPGDSTEFEVPALDDAVHAAGFAEGSIFDYFGLPTKVAAVSQNYMPIALPARAYNKVFNDWYRDENYQNSLTVDRSNGPDTTVYTVQTRNRRKDYFTSVLPLPQKGPAVTLPLGTSAPVLGIGKVNTNSGTPGPASYYETGKTTTTAYAQSSYIDPASTSAKFGVRMTGDPGYPSIYADLTEATSITVEALRNSITLQQILELDSRGGTRYVEALLTRFGVVSPDFRLQRSEFLGGQTIEINVNPIAQTSETNDTPQGSLAAYAVGRGRAGVSHSFVEHGQLIGIVSVRAETTYQQGINRHWSVRTRYDYYEPMMANLGEQAVLNKEIFQDGSVDDEGVFGYQERWGEYRYKPSYVSGAFRSNAAAPLDSWHLAIDFEDLPEAADIMPEAPPVSRIISVPSQPHFIMDSYTRFKHVRVMPIYSSPGLSRL